jgi:hypothetical protein
MEAREAEKLISGRLATGSGMAKKVLLHVNSIIVAVLTFILQVRLFQLFETRVALISYSATSPRLR